MSTLRAALAVSLDPFAVSRIIAVSRVVATLLATSAMVLGASLIAVALSLA